ncbi:MAG: class I SAM-dependent methyltransferase [Anaerolineaceae bacterium]|nr:class I SAM-dependent methyltransferase [Anaerolineaceae bacterium]
MNPDTVAVLLDLNREFYQKFAAAFAATRRRIQPGVRHILESLSPAGSWLDLGCGSGALAAAFARAPASNRASYTGMDFSAELLDEARRALDGIDRQRVSITFELADLSHPGWIRSFPPHSFDGVFAFAVLHHLPGVELRNSLLRQVHALLRPKGLFYFSVWQFQHSPRLMSRCVAWKSIGLKPTAVDAGDTLIDWRFALPHQAGETGLRYVHLFNHAELDLLAHDNGFESVDSFESDGEGGRLGLYQVWRAVGE